MAVPNALNSSYMEGRSMGMAKPYAQIQSGAQMGPRELLAYNNANTLGPIQQRQARNNALVNVDPAFDIRENSQQNRMDLREKMGQDASLERQLQQQVFTADQGEKNRQATREATEAQMKSTAALQAGMLQSREREGQAGRQSAERMATQEISSRMTVAGLDRSSAESIANLRGQISRANNWESVNATYQTAMARITQMEKDSKRLDDRAKEQLKFEKKRIEDDLAFEREKYDASEEGKKDFGQTLGRVWNEYREWSVPPVGGGKSGKEKYREQEDEAWFRGEGLGFLMEANNQTAEIVDPNGKQIPMFIKKGGPKSQKVMNPEWLTAAKEIVFNSPNGRIAWDGAVNRRVIARDTALMNNLQRFQGAAASQGIGIPASQPSPSRTPSVLIPGSPAKGNPFLNSLNKYRKPASSSGMVNSLGQPVPLVPVAPPPVPPIPPPTNQQLNLPPHGNNSLTPAPVNP